MQRRVVVLGIVALTLAAVLFLAEQQANAQAPHMLIKPGQTFVASHLDLEPGGLMINWHKYRALEVRGTWIFVETPKGNFWLNLQQVAAIKDIR